MLQRQQEIEHSVGIVGVCPFCQTRSAELWYNPDDMDIAYPYQVRCGACGARGPRADCGWESAVPSWDMVHRKEIEPQWRGPGSSVADPHS